MSAPLSTRSPHSMIWKAAPLKPSSLRERARLIREKVLQTADAQATGVCSTGANQEYALILERDLAKNEKAQGTNSLRSAKDLDRLASSYSAQARYGDAERLFQRSLAIREKALGPDHPDVAASLAGLAKLYDDTGRDADALPLYSRSLTIRTKTLGPDHPDLAPILDKLGERLSSFGPVCHCRDGLQALACNPRKGNGRR